MSTFSTEKIQAQKKLKPSLTKPQIQILQMQLFL